MAKLKILLACIPTPGNRYLIDLKTGLESFADVIWNAEQFWGCEHKFDVIHIHWPEYLSYEIESYLYNNQNISPELWKRLISCLNYWSVNSKILYTRHNDLPHANKNKDFKRLYELVSSYAKTIVHFGNYSIEQFKKWYPDLNQCHHTVIPHHNYNSLLNDSTKEEARKKLNISTNALVMLVFGGVRYDQKRLISQAFKAIPHKDKVLLAPKWRIKKTAWGFKTLGILMVPLKKYWNRFINNRVVDLDYIQEEDVQYFLNSADFLFISRTDELNTGNIALGFTFGKVVIGKQNGIIGEVLGNNGNPTFKIADDHSLKKAVLQAIHLSKNNYGRLNKKKSDQEWSVQSIANSYFDLMK